jgi:predicted ATPase/DNA-binding SARP family transcriptional activator
MAERLGGVLLSDSVARSHADPPNNLVPAVTSFVGREAEIERLRHLLEEARLVTLTGPPGAGKTRLASETAIRMLHELEDGAWFVGLASLRDPELVLPATAEALGLLSASAGSPLDGLIARLRDRPALVILDNFEHVLDAAMDIAALLAGAPALRILVTSRTLLHLSGEHEYALAPLPLPEPETSPLDLARADVVELFSRRAAASEPTFQVDETNAADVAELCRRLDGLPLAIELAAARVKVLSLAAILARVDRPLVLLTGGPRDQPVRHQSLRAAVAWSYDLLEPDAQELFRRLSVFRGGWTIEGAAAVFAAGSADPDALLETLASLLDSSLIVRDPSAEADPRFTMLETLREFAADRLDDAGESELAQARHAAYFLELAEREEPRFTGPDPASALNRIAHEHDNVRAALTHLIDHEPEGALRLGAALWRFWQMRGYLLEGDRWLNAALQAAGEGADDRLRAEALGAKGSLAYWRGDMTGARKSYEEALEIRRRIGDDLRTAGALYDLAFVFAPYFFPPPADPERTEHGMSLLREAANLYENARDAPGIARTGWMLGNLMLYQDVREAERVLRSSVERFRGLDDPFGLGWALRMHGCALLGIQDTAAAGATFREALSLFSTAGDGSALGLLISDFADLARLEGDGVRAARLKGAAARLRQTTEAELANVEDVPWVARAPALKDMIDATALGKAWSEGRAMSQAEAIGYALGADTAPASDETLRVTALGRFAVERAGVPLTHWGGQKAGSRQAQAMFGFLLDRGERGVSKDEFIEVIWPDAEVTQGDLNFHRTLGGLRGTLEPDKSSGSPGAVVFANGRYRLDPGLVGWQDVDEFEQHVLHAAQATDALAAIRSLEAARSLYPGDYLDDCPIYGDSGYVEEHRSRLRGRFTDALVDLGRRYEDRGDAILAAARFREAIDVAGGECPAASAGLERLGAAIGA